MVHVFKTSVKSQNDIQIASWQLEQLKKTIIWNFDLDDCDHILRVVSKDVSSDEIINAVSQSGFYCEELNR